MPTPLRPPRIASSLTSVADPELEDDGEWTDLDISGAIEGSCDRLDVAECRFTRVRLTGVALSRAVFRDCVFDECEMSGFDADEIAMERCEVNDSRMSGAVLSSARLRHVRFTRTRLNDANFRMSSGDTVHFVECDLTDADFGGAKFESSRFDRCNLTTADFTKATMVGTSLHGSHLEAIRGVSGLRGVTIDASNAFELSMMLLPEFGIAITDSPDD